MTDSKPQRVALVTGGAARLGRAIATGLAKDGYDLLVTYRSSESDAREVARTVQRLGQRCELLRADLAEAHGAEAAAEAVARTFGRLDLLVNSAASFDSRPLFEVDAATWDAVMNLNVRAPHLLVRATAGLLRRARGSVVNIADLSAFEPWPSRPHHSVSKAALVHLTKVQARALAPQVRVNSIAPGAVLPPSDMTEDARQALAQAAPLRKLGSPQDVVDAILFLARAEFVTGEILVVDGGRLIATPDR